MTITALSVSTLPLIIPVRSQLPGATPEDLTVWPVAVAFTTSPDRCSGDYPTPDPDNPAEWTTGEWLAGPWRHDGRLWYRARVLIGPGHRVLTPGLWMPFLRITRTGDRPVLASRPIRIV